jgi:MoaA/NifB/PqqE/SkfB family radical SAM enzyme
MRFIDPEGKLLRHPDRLANWRAGQFTPPIGIEVDLSNRCNLGCQDCHFGYAHSRGPLTHRAFGNRPLEALGDLMDLTLFTRIREQLESAGVRSITFSGGGEPTTHPEFERFLDQAEKSPLKFGLYTNGTRIDSTLAKRLKQILTWIVISLDEPDRESYRALKQVDLFEQAVAGIRHLTAAEGPAVIGISFLIHAGNFRRLQEMADFGRSLAPSYVEFRPTIKYRLDAPDQPLGDARWISDALPDLIKLGQEEWIEARLSSFRNYWQWERPYTACHAVHFTGVISPNGRVWTCVNRRGFKDSLVGDLRRETFQEVWSRVKSVEDLTHCRVMCRGHALNLQLDRLARPLPHEEFI